MVFLSFFSYFSKCFLGEETLLEIFNFSRKRKLFFLVVTHKTCSVIPQTVPGPLFGKQCHKTWTTDMGQTMGRPMGWCLGPPGSSGPRAAARELVSLIIQAWLPALYAWRLAIFFILDVFYFIFQLIMPKLGIDWSIIIFYRSLSSNKLVCPFVLPWLCPWVCPFWQYKDSQHRSVHTECDFFL